MVELISLAMIGMFHSLFHYPFVGPMLSFPSQIVEKQFLKRVFPLEIQSMIVTLIVSHLGEVAEVVEIVMKIHC